MDPRCECSKSELDIFSLPPVNVSMERGGYINYLPVSTITDQGPIEFNVNSSTDEYIDLGRTSLYLKVQVLNKDGSHLAADAKVAPVNLFMHSLFSQVDLRLRDTLISPSTNTYPFKAYLEQLLSYGEDAKNTQFRSELWDADYGSMNDTNPHDEGTKNLALTRRAWYTNQSKCVEMIGKIHTDLFQQDKYLLNGVDFNLKLIRSTPAFHLMGEANEFITKIKEAVLYVRKVKLNPTIALSHSKLLDQGKFAKYPIRRGVVTSFTISQNSLSFNKDNVVSGQLPRRIVVGFVRNEAFNGNIKYNPFNFEHFHLNYLSFSTGSETIPSQPLKPNFEEHQFLRSYMTLFEGTGIRYANTGNCITRGNFAKGYALYCLDLTPDLSTGNHCSPIKHGNLRMEVHFAKALPCTVNVVVYSEFENIVQIDRSRNIVTDFT